MAMCYKIYLKYENNGFLLVKLLIFLLFIQFMSI